jgi:hypothetical protein
MYPNNLSPHILYQQMQYQQMQYQQMQYQQMPFFNIGSDANEDIGSDANEDIDSDASKDEESHTIWSLCEDITLKENWYSKVFNEEIVENWRQELPKETNEIFNLAIRLLRVTVQGSIHLENCDWDDDTNMCNDCKDTLKQMIMNNPKDFGISESPEYFSHENSLFEYFDKGWEYDYDEWAKDNCKHPRCKCTAPHSELNDFIEYHPQGINEDLHLECKSVITEMAAQEPIDWHPGSNNQVRDIIHPSMYCYVKGISSHNDGHIASECEENKRYQWLPSKFSVGSNGEVQVLSYVNNLKTDKYPRFIPMVTRVFEYFIPSLEKVLDISIKDRNLQVIVKVGSINLNITNPTYSGGSWHIEGMPYENIAATCIHYVDVDNITPSFLEFRKPVIINEYNLDYPQNDMVYSSHHYGIVEESHYDGTMNRHLGLIRCHEGASVVFPNTLQHKVKDFSLNQDATSSLRTILAFFVIDPCHTIISTEDIPPQQNIFTIEQANFHRERLMIHRKYFMDDLNKTVFEREFSLCEH